MKIFSRTISFLLTVILCITTAVNIFSQDEQGIVGADSQTQLALEKLIAFGIMSKADTHQWEDVITRAEFADYMLKAVNMGDYQLASKIFGDVDLDYWAAGQIATGVQMGWFSGFSDGNFYPESPILPDQAIKTMVSILGYDTFAMTSGGYPLGYSIVANQINLTKSTGVHDVSEINFAVVVRLMANMLEIDTMEGSGFGKYTTYTGRAGNTILNKIYSIEKKKGVVEETIDTGLYGKSTLSGDRIKINGQIFTLGGTDAHVYLGYQLEFYARFEGASEEGEMVFFTPSSTNSVTVVQSERIVDSDSAYSFVYEDGRGRTTSKSVPAGVAFIYNGTAKPGYAKQDLKPEKGNVTIIDNDNDGTLDCIIVFKVDNTIFLSLRNRGENGYILHDRNDAFSNVVLPMVGEKENFKVYKNGIVISISEVNEESILSVGFDELGEYAVIMVSDTRLTGLIAEINSDYEAVIEGEEDSYRHKISQEYMVLSGREGYDAKPLEVGTSGIFYLDFMGEICAANVGISAELQYGYVLGAYMETSGVGNVGQIKLISMNQGVRIYNVAQNVYLEDQKVNVSDLFGKDGKSGKLLTHGTEYPISFKSPNEYLQLIKYRLNEDEEITSIYQSRGGKLTYDGSIYNQDEYAHYKSTWANKYYRDLSTQIFYIYADEDLCEVSNVYTIPDNRKEQDYFYFYDVNEKGMAKVVVTYPASGAANNNVDKYTRISVVTGLSRSIDREGQTVDAIKCYTNGEPDSILYSESYMKVSPDKQNIFKYAKPGDILIYDRDSRGDVARIIKVFDVSEDWFGQHGINANDDKRDITFDIADGETVTYSFNSPQGFLFAANSDNPRIYYATLHHQRRMVAAKVGKVFSDCFQFMINPEDPRIQFVGAGVSVYKVILNKDGSVKVLPNRSYSELMPGDEVFYRSEVSDVKEMVIYEDRRN